MGSKATFLIIDGNNLLYRAFYALPRLTASNGTPTGAVYGFVNSLQKVRERFSPSYLCVVLDAPGPTFREELYDRYKEKRQKMPEDIALQLPIVKEIIDLSGIRRVEIEGVEADDVIGSICRRAAEQDLQVIIVSSDKDLCQLVTDDVQMFDSLKDSIIKPEDVEKKFGVGPGGIVDFIALSGDPTDNIPGVPGIGGKTAAALLKEFGSVENLIRNLDFVKGRKKELLKENLESLEVSKRLAKIKDDVPLALQMGDFKPGEADRDGLLNLLRKLGFRAEAARDEGRDDLISEGQRAGVSYGAIRNFEEAKEAFKSVTDSVAALVPSASGEIGVVGVSVGGESYVVNRDVIGEAIDLLAGRGVRFIGHDLKSAVWGCPPLEKVFDLAYGDTMLLSYLLHPEESSLALSRMLTRYTGVEIETEFVTEEERVAVLSGGVRRLSGPLESSLAGEGFLKLYEELELPLLRVLYGMEKRGVKLEADRLKGLSRRLDGELREIEGSVGRYSGGEVNLSSPKQVSFLLFEKLGLPPVKRTKTGFSTDVEVLEQLSPLHEAPSLILSHRTLSKLKSTYVDVLPHMVDSSTGRVHTSFNQMQTATGRLSSSNPNLQNIPVRTGYGREIREAFVPGEGFLFVCADYSQIELRVLAHLSGDERLRAVFEKDRDVHRETAMALFDVGEGEITPELRRKAKIVNFGVLYGMTPFGLSKELKIPQPEAKKYIDDYFDRYPGVMRFIDGTLDGAREKGYVETLLGRRRYIRDINSRNQALRQAAERMAVNAPVQGTAADIIKLSMVELEGKLKEKNIDAHIILQVHDELILEARADVARDAGGLLKDVMEGIVSLDVPLKVDVKSGYSWGALSAGM
ncbi:MAG: DNA polymerase I [Deltaproteobacteria bacterium]|nr:DNA polymerase I [Deltaproteobacteria bacterium]NIS77419.1 DNA polymerase I [Deltaproteobacteria bacterium]